jgi:hypothetical protein
MYAATTMRKGTLTCVANSTYAITQLLPPEGDEFQYDQKRCRAA